MVMGDNMVDQTGWPNDQSACLPVWQVMGSEPHGFKPWSSQTNDIKLDTCCFLARCSALLGQSKEQLNKEDQSYHQKRKKILHNICDV